MSKMHKTHQAILIRLRKSIVMDVDVDNGVIGPLKTEAILKEEDVVKIKAGNDKEERAQILLDILPSCGPYAFDAFRQALRLNYGWLSEDMDRLEITEKSVTDAKLYIAPPNITPMSPMTVIRKEKMAELKSKLEKLEPGGYIALHGMKGFGKSCLTASTLKDTKLVSNVFYNQVYWIKFGYERQIEEEILIQLNKLYYLVKNIEMLPESSTLEPLKDLLIHFLKYHFNKEENQHALLILDDVCDPKIISAFDFHCKTLVITADIDVLQEKRPIVIQMNDGFTEAETLGLFAKVLDTELDKLPIEAKRIHEECKGMPLLISMFAAQFEEFKHDMKRRPDRWRYYLNSLKMKDAQNTVLRKFFEKQEATFDECINQLPADMKKNYTELAIFTEDVNITSQTLQILWDGQPFKVEEIMLDLCHKSLAAKQWNAGLDCYIYGVHDLLLRHLRKKLSSNELVDMHKSLIEKYRKYCKGDFSKLPQDNYSHSFIGHHLEQAKMYDEFSNIYLNFDFIQAVINQAGLSNLLIDLKKYKEHITKNYNNAYEMYFNDLEKFLEEQASVIAEHRRKKCLDITQIAMNHPYQGYVRDNANILAMERIKKLYLSHEKKLGYIDVPISEEVSTEICTSCFTYDPNLILIGNRVGEIFLWDSMSKKQKPYHGYTKKSSITKIIISAEGDCFICLSDNGVAKLFLLNDDDHCDEYHLPIQSPRQKQICWSSIFSNRTAKDDSVAIFAVEGEAILDVTFGHDDNYIATCTNKGRIQVWDRRGNTLFDCFHNSHNNSYLKNIAFTMEGSLLHIMDEVDGVLISYVKNNDKYKYSSQYNPGLQGKKIIFFRNVPEQSNSLLIVTEDKAVHIKSFRVQIDSLHSYNKQIRANVEHENTVYVCASLTQDGQYFILADSAGFINVWHIDNGFQPIATYKSRVSSLDTYWLRNEGYHVICGSENRLLHRWKLPLEETQKSLRKPLFDAVVQPFGKADTVATQTVSNTVVTLHGDKKITESEPVDGKILNMIFSADGKKLVYVIENGTVILFDIEARKGMPVLKLPHTMDFVKILNIENNDIIVCRETDDNLRVWQSKKITYLVDNAGYVASIHQVNAKCVITVTRNGIIRVWDINNTNWRKIYEVPSITFDILITHSCLSYGKSVLAILTKTNHLILYAVQEYDATLPAQLKIFEYFKKNYDKSLVCCDISQNEQYVAVGFENGEILIIDILLREEVRKLTFHTSSITQLCWAPSVVDAPVLLSVNGDEMAWWNITLGEYNVKTKRRSRIGIGRSSSSPVLNRHVHSQLTTSQSAGLNLCSMRSEGSTDIANGAYNISKFWKCKEGKDPAQPALLAVVQLPPNFLAKVCISTDFTKFLTVDIYGSISTFTLFGYT